jgi:predicted enzyme related to lactoylglutathione lyase
MTLPRVLPVLLATTILAACASSGANVPPASGSPSTSDSRFVWQDLVTTDAAAARRFYSALRGWEFAETSRGGRPCAIARTATGQIGGLVDVQDIKDAGSQWISYVTVANIVL